MEKIKELLDRGELTELESNVMNWLLKTGYYAEKYFSDVEVKDIAKGLDIKVNVVKGVIGSLIKKEYLFTEFRYGHWIYATDKGYQLDDNYLERWGDEVYR